MKVFSSFQTLWKTLLLKKENWELTKLDLITFYIVHSSLIQIGPKTPRMDPWSLGSIQVRLFFFNNLLDSLLISKEVASGLNTTGK